MFEFSVTLPAWPYRIWLRLAHAMPQDRPSRPGRAVPLRVLSDFEFVFQAEGESQICWEGSGGWRRLVAGDLILLPPGFRHGWTGRPGTHYAVHFDLEARPELGTHDTILSTGRTVPWAEPLSRSEAPPVIRLHCPSSGRRIRYPLIAVPADPAGVRRRLDLLVQLHRSGRMHEPLAQWRATQVLTGLLLDRCEPGEAAPESDGPRERVVAQLEALATLPSRELPPVEELARRSGLGLTAFRAAFRRETGRTPRDFLERRRMEEAARALLHGGLRVQEVAALVGYDDPYHFSRVFKRVHGTSPRAWRESRLGG